VDAIYVEKNIDKKEENESNAVQKEDIGDVCNIGVTEDLHLLLRRTHEEEAGRVEKECREVLETMRIRPIGAEGAPIPQDKGDFDDPGGAGGHQSISKNTVHHRAERQELRVSGHGVAGQENDDSRNKIALRPAIPLPTQPDAEQTGAPPDDAHARVLEVVVDPGTAPAVFGEGVDTAPESNDQRVEEFLAPARPTQPVLAGEEKDGE